MPKNKRDSSSGSDSDSSGVRDSPPPQKKKAKSDNKEKSSKGGTSAVRNSNGEVTWDLSSNKKINIRSFRGKTYIDIREYYDKNGEQLPTKKGISLTPELYQKFKSLISEIDEELNKF